jgi:hypothetical protein
MFIFFLILAIVFGLALIIGFVWGFIARGKTLQRTEPDARDGGMSDRMNVDRLKQDKIQIPVTGNTGFFGKTIEGEGNADLSFIDIKKMLAGRKLRQALPPLLMMTGVVGLTFFLGVTLLTRADTLVTGVILLAFSIYCAYMILTGFILNNH